MPMRPHTPRVFIASSEKAITLAKALAFFLNENRIECQTWAVDTFHGAHNTLSELLNAARQDDFAVVLLTQDDTVSQTKEGKSVILNAPRDNCIFELGLFIGSLSRERCFMVSSVGQTALPSDLRGETYIPFKEEGNIDDWNQCKNLMRAVHLKILNGINQAGVFRRPEIPLLTFDELLDLESADDISRGSEVVVHTDKPYETRYRYARIVRNNLRRGINYHYFFGREPVGAVEIVYLIRSLAVVDLDLGNVDWENLDERERWKILESNTNQKTVRETLEEIRSQLSIHVLPYKVSEAFCIHNAGIKKPEKCYLRWYDDINFIEIPDAAKAHTKYEAYHRFRHRQRNTLFGANSFFTVKQIDKDLGLSSLIRQNFPSPLSSYVRNICFGDKLRPTGKTPRNLRDPVRRSSAPLPRTHHNSRN